MRHLPPLASGHGLNQLTCGKGAPRARRSVLCPIVTVVTFRHPAAMLPTSRVFPRLPAFRHRDRKPMGSRLPGPPHIFNQQAVW